jgi:hypothetical protein
MRETRIELNLDTPAEWSNEQIQNFVRMALNARINTLNVNRSAINMPAYTLKVQGVIVL